MEYHWKITGANNEDSLCYYCRHCTVGRKYWVINKRFHLVFSALSRLPRIKLLSLSKFSRYLVMVKIVNMNHGRKNLFCKNKHHISIVHICQIFIFLLGHLHFCASFLHFYGEPFYGSPNIWIWWVEHWAICPSTCSFARNAHSFACSTLLTSLVRFMALIRSLACSLTLELMGKRFLPMKLTCRFQVDFLGICMSVHEQARMHSIRCYETPFSADKEKAFRTDGPTDVPSYRLAS